MRAWKHRQNFHQSTRVAWAASKAGALAPRVCHQRIGLLSLRKRLRRAGVRGITTTRKKPDPTRCRVRLCISLFSSCYTAGKFFENWVFFFPPKRGRKVRHTTLRNPKVSLGDQKEATMNTVKFNCGNRVTVTITVGTDQNGNVIVTIKLSDEL